MTELPRWESENREAKARMIHRVLIRFGSGRLRDAVCIDLGCGSGVIAAALAPHVKQITGIDPEPWPYWEEHASRQFNLAFLQQSVEHLSLPDSCADVVICNQVYEHVADPRLLIAEIHRLLKPGGCCYFAGPNLLFPIEPHVYWPFVHWLPRNSAVWLMRLLGSKRVVDANSVTYWTLKEWLKPFDTRNILPDLLSDPDFYEIPGRFVRFFSWLPRRIVASLTWVSPSFIFVLRKPDTAA